MVAPVLGGNLTQWPVGWWSDHADRRIVVAIPTLIATGAGAALAAVADLNTLSMLFLAWLLGAAALPLYSVAVAHANDRAPAGAFVEVSGDLLLMFGIGAALGPVAAGVLMEAHPGAVFAWTAAIHLALALVALDRIRREPPVAEADEAGFVAVPRTTQAVLPPDPRADAAEEPA